jgi:hypothetical protein
MMLRLYVYCQESTSYEVSNQSAIQEIFCFLWNSKISYSIHKSPSLVPILNQMNPVHTLPPYFFEILSPIPRSFKWFLLFRLSDQ